MSIIRALEPLRRGTIHHNVHLAPSSCAIDKLMSSGVLNERVERER